MDFVEMQNLMDWIVMWPDNRADKKIGKSEIKQK